MQPYEGSVLAAAGPAAAAGAAAGGGAGVPPGGGGRGGGGLSASALFSVFSSVGATGPRAFFPSSSFSATSPPLAAARRRHLRLREAGSSSRGLCGFGAGSSRSRSSSERGGWQSQPQQQQPFGLHGPLQLQARSGVQQQGSGEADDGDDGVGPAFAFETLLQQQQQEYGRLLRHCGAAAAAAEEAGGGGPAGGGVAAAAAALLLKQQLSAGAGSAGCGGTAGPAAQPPPATASRQRGRHTIVCRHWLKGMCMKGDFCDFLHQLIYLRMPACRNQLWCPDIRRGCCPFKHAELVQQQPVQGGAAEAADLRGRSTGRGSSSAEQQLLLQQPQQKECLAYFLGFCKLGPKCRRRHTPRHRSELPAALPAWYLSLVVANANLVFPSEIDPETEEELAAVSARCRQLCETGTAAAAGRGVGVGAAAAAGMNRSAFCSSLPRAAAAERGASSERRSGSHRRDGGGRGGTRTATSWSGNGSKTQGTLQRQQHLAGTTAGEAWGAGDETGTGGPETATAFERLVTMHATPSQAAQQQQEGEATLQQEQQQQQGGPAAPRPPQGGAGAMFGSDGTRGTVLRPGAAALVAAAAGGGGGGYSSRGSRRASGSCEPEAVYDCVVPLLVDAFNRPATPRSRKRFFIIKCNKMNNICTSVQLGVWATSRLNSKRLSHAFNDAEHVLLLFSANESGGVQGFARMMSLPDPSLFPAGMLWGAVQLRLGSNFRVRWLKQCRAEFEELGKIHNPWNDNLPLKKSRDGTELPPALGAMLCARLAQLPSEDLLAATGVDPSACIDHSTFFSVLAQNGMLPISAAAAAAADGAAELPQPSKPIELAADSVRFAQQQQLRHVQQQH